LGRVLLLGATGFIGRHVQREFTATRPVDELVCVARADHADGDPVQVVRWRALDLVAASRQAIVDLVRDVRPSAVVNCAGVTDGDLEAQIAGNVLLVGRLLDALRDAAPAIRFVHVASAAESGASTGKSAVDEESPTEPITPYGVAKLAASQLVLAARRTAGGDGIVLRLFNPIGAGMSQGSLPGHAAAAMRDALAGGSPVRLGPLDAYRDFVDVRDVSRAIVAAAIAPSIGSPVLNVGRGEAVQARWLVRELARIAGYGGPIEEVEDPGSPRSQAIRWQAASIDRIREALGWQPRFTLHEALGELWSAVIGSP